MLELTVSILAIDELVVGNQFECPGPSVPLPVQIIGMVMDPQIHLVIDRLIMFHDEGMTAATWVKDEINERSVGTELMFQLVLRECPLLPVPRKGVFVEYVVRPAVLLAFDV